MEIKINGNNYIIDDASNVTYHENKRVESFFTNNDLEIKTVAGKNYTSKGGHVVHLFDDSCIASFVILDKNKKKRLFFNKKGESRNEIN